MTYIILYTKKNCPFSSNAVALCNSLQLPFKEYSIDGNHPKYYEIKAQLFDVCKHYSFPIIIIGNTVLGGFSELNNAYKNNTLYNICIKHGINMYK
jgi:glutaredoxin